MSNRIKYLREKAGLNQYELAEFLNVSQGTLSNWERGIHDIDNDSLIILAKKFEVTTDYLLGTSSSPTASYTAQNIQNSNFVQGSGSVTVGDGVSCEESELLRIYRALDVRSRLKLLSTAIELEDELKNNG